VPFRGVPETSRVATERAHGPESGEGAEQLRWFCGVPIATNALILKDLARTLAILAGSAVAFVLLVQRIAGGPVGGAQLRVAAVLAWYVVGFVAAAFAIAAIPLFGNHYVVLYRFFPDLVYCESMRGRFFSFRNAFHMRAFPVEPMTRPGRSATKVVPWERVVGFKADDSRRVIHLEGAKGTLMRVYCPDADMYTRVLACVGERTSDACLAAAERRST